MWTQGEVSHAPLAPLASRFREVIYSRVGFVELSGERKTARSLTSLKLFIVNSFLTLINKWLKSLSVSLGMSPPAFLVTMLINT